MNRVSENLASIRHRIATAATRCGRDASQIRLVAVSKTYGSEIIRLAWDAGQHVFGENRVQDALPKIPELPSEAEWHFIGHMQTNKIRKALPHFALFHGIDNLDLARQMSRIAGELHLTANILLEVNVSGEESKFGFSPDALRYSLNELLSLPHIQIQGLMTMAPYSDNPESARPCFTGLRNLRDELQKISGAQLPELSMGMSGDFEIAIEEGATIVRVGSSIFGERITPQNQ
jgi:pyridoxal phosphate enzyme (YggS family)